VRTVRDYRPEALAVLAALQPAGFSVMGAALQPAGFSVMGGSMKVNRGADGSIVLPEGWFVLAQNVPVERGDRFTRACLDRWVEVSTAGQETKFGFLYIRRAPLKLKGFVYPQPGLTLAGWPEKNYPERI
jgi:hypothetical protein